MGTVRVSYQNEEICLYNIVPSVLFTCCSSSKYLVSGCVVRNHLKQQVLVIWITRWSKYIPTMTPCSVIKIMAIQHSEYRINDVTVSVISIRSLINYNRRCMLTYHRVLLDQGSNFMALPLTAACCNPTNCQDKPCHNTQYCKAF